MEFIFALQFTATLRGRARQARGGDKSLCNNANEENTQLEFEGGIV